MTTECQHHWELPPANGTVSVGICRKCGESKDFYNSFETANFDISKAHSGRDRREDLEPGHRDSWPF